MTQNTKPSYTASQIQARLVSILAKALQVEPSSIDIQQSWESYGIDSAQALVILSEVEQFLGLKLSPMLVWHYPTIELLSQRLAEEFV